MDDLQQRMRIHNESIERTQNSKNEQRGPQHRDISKGGLRSIGEQAINGGPTKPKILNAPQALPPRAPLQDHANRLQRNGALN